MPEVETFISTPRGLPCTPPIRVAECGVLAQQAPEKLDRRLGRQTVVHEAACDEYAANHAIERVTQDCRPPSVDKPMDACQWTNAQADDRMYPREETALGGSRLCTVNFQTPCDEDRSEPEAMQTAGGRRSSTTCVDLKKRASGEISKVTKSG